MISASSKRYCKFRHLDEKAIIFESFGGRSYGDSPRALYESMLADPRFQSYKFIWMLRQPEQYAFLAKNSRTNVVTFDFKAYAGFIYDVSNHPSINDLYIISDVLITDYSSVLFDFAILQRPMLFYMYDQKHYQTELRGFYLPIEALPGDIVTTQAELTAHLTDLTAYGRRTDQALQAFHAAYNYLEDGQATA